jgi:hypothetical protein
MGRNLIFSKTTYGQIFIVETLSQFKEVSPKYSIDSDLFLTFDFDLKKHIVEMGGEALYIDNMNNSIENQQNNFILQSFLENWALSPESKDLFTYKGVSFSRAFRILFLSELFELARLRSSLNNLNFIRFESITLIEHSSKIENILLEMNMTFSHHQVPILDSSNSFYFDDAAYMEKSLRPAGLKSFIHGRMFPYYFRLKFFLDKRCNVARSKKTIYVHAYHPTESLIEAMQGINDVHLVYPNFVKGKGIRKLVNQSQIPYRGCSNFHFEVAIELIKGATRKFNQKLVLVDGQDLTSKAYELITNKISDVLPQCLSDIDVIIFYQKAMNIRLSIPVSSLGVRQILVESVLDSYSVPSFLILNGMMNSKFGDESKKASIINCYSEGIKREYFKEAKNALPLGDPRMDRYSFQSPKRFDSNVPEKITVGVGTSGFNSIDLNSYAAIEFEFINDILEILEDRSPFITSIVLKTRANNSRKQYEKFINEHWNTSKNRILLSEISDFSNFIASCDVYISTYSQTLFEAAAAGVPPVYYKKDVEKLYPPFDDSGELMTAPNREALAILIDKVLDKKSNLTSMIPSLDYIEEYVGKVDGQSMRRNLEFIMRICG